MLYIYFTQSDFLDSGCGQSFSVMPSNEKGNISLDTREDFKEIVEESSNRNDIKSITNRFRMLTHSNHKSHSYLDIYGISKTYYSSLIKNCFVFLCQKERRPQWNLSYSI